MASSHGSRDDVAVETTSPVEEPVRTSSEDRTFILGTAIRSCRALRSYGLHTCGATLIAPGCIAQHCIDCRRRRVATRSPSSDIIWLADPLTLARKPSASWLHADTVFSGGPNFAFDIAVLDVEPVRSFGVQCASSIEYPALDGSSGGVSLGPAFDVPHAGESAIALGWGSTSYDTATQTSGPTSNELREVTLPVQSDQYCSTHLPGYESPYMLCAGHPSGGHDTCSGDSGGPLILPATAAGAPLTLIAVASGDMAVPTTRLASTRACSTSARGS